MKAIWNGAVLAESNDTVEIEGNAYFPPGSINKKYFLPSDTHTRCPWKGLASYYNVSVDNKVNQDAAWYYPKPQVGSKTMAGHDFTNYLAFWNGVEIQT